MSNARRFRGVFGLAATWGVALSALATSSLVIGLATGLVPESIFGARELIAVAVRGLVAGAVAGGIFGWLLSARERHQTLATLSSGRAALWGGVAAGSVPLLIALAAAGPVLPFGVLAAGIGVAAIGGGVFASSLLRLARRSDKAIVAAPDEADRRLR